MGGNDECTLASGGGGGGAKKGGRFCSLVTASQLGLGGRSKRGLLLLRGAENHRGGKGRSGKAEKCFEGGKPTGMKLAIKNQRGTP